MTHLALILAASDGIALKLFAAQMVCNVLLFIFTFTVRRKASETDSLRDKVNQRDEVIAKQVKREVDLRIGAMEVAVKKLIERDHQSEIEQLKELHELKLYVTEHCATKTGMKDLEKKMTALREDVIRAEKDRGAA
ncbi:MAG: hypothetical protein AAGI37_06855 [Planctomycetota bacterium]